MNRSGYTFLGMNRQPGGMYHDPPYQSSMDAPMSKEIPFSVWWPTYLKAMYIIARTIQVQD